MISVVERRELRLRQIFGDAAYEGMDEGTLGLLEAVVDWYELGIGDTVGQRRKQVADAIWEAAKRELGENVDDVRTKCRTRTVNDVRQAMFLLAYEYMALPKSMIGEALGIARDHATILYGIKRAEGLIKYDAQFRRLYQRLARSVHELLSVKQEM